GQRINPVLVPCLDLSLESSIGQARYAPGTAGSARGFVPHGNRIEGQIRAVRGGVRTPRQGRQDRASPCCSVGDGRGVEEARQSCSAKEIATLLGLSICVVPRIVGL